MPWHQPLLTLQKAMKSLFQTLTARGNSCKTMGPQKAVDDK